MLLLFFSFFRCGQPRPSNFLCTSPHTGTFWVLLLCSIYIATLYAHTWDLNPEILQLQQKLKDYLMVFEEWRAPIYHNHVLYAHRSLGLFIRNTHNHSVSTNHCLPWSFCIFVQFNITEIPSSLYKVELYIQLVIVHRSSQLVWANCMQHMPRVVDLGVSNIVGVAVVKFKESGCGLKRACCSNFDAGGPEKLSIFF